MALSVRRSILRRAFLAGGCLTSVVLVLAAPALAQHPGNRYAGTPPPAPPPPAMHAPINHAPVYRAPIYQAPTYQAPIYRTPQYAAVSGRGISAEPHVRGLGPVSLRPRPRPFPPFRYYPFPVFIYPFWPSNVCWWATCDLFWTAALLDNNGPASLWSPSNSFPPPAAEAPVYVYGEEQPEYPQLFLKDGTILYVTDYWVVDDQLHFMIAQQEGMKPEEQVIPFDELDLQKTIDVNTQRGFRFMLRNEPFEQYVRDHPEGPPAALSGPNQ